MKKGLQTFLLYLLSALVISTSSAWSVTSMQCKRSGYSHYHMGQDGCCGDEEGSTGEEVKSECCEVDQLAFGMELAQPKLEKKDLKFESQGIPTFEVPFADVTNDDLNHLIDAPPAEEDFLSLHCVLLI